MVRNQWIMRLSSMLFFPDTIAPYVGARIETYPESTLQETGVSLLGQERGLKSGYGCFVL
ncbi:hypothetical protein C4A76_00930 [Brevibacillus laterosporus]|nr:hypothetical protein C4A76_00930 [Brevibacillus laterosporus]